MRELKQRWRRCKKARHKKDIVQPRVKPFTLSENEFTRPPIIVPYLVHGHGVLQSFRLHSDISQSNRPTRGGDKVTAAIPRPPVHYFRFREWMRYGDPCQLSGGCGDRSRIASKILASEAGERRIKDREIWERLLCGSETHVLRLGWQSQITGENHDILYIPLTFTSADLAREFGEYLVCHLQKEPSLKVLCPSIQSFYDVQVFWLVIAYWHLRWELLGEDLREKV